MKNNKKIINKNQKNGVVLITILGITLITIMFVSPTAQSFAKSLLGQSEVAKVAVINNEVQEISIDLKSRAYEPIIVQKGVPVKFNIKATSDSINGCNGTVVIPDLNLEKTLVPGDNIIEFTPQSEGTIAYSCWMGMVRSSIEVVSDLNSLK